METTHVVLDSPIGPLTMVVTDGGLSGLYMEKQRHLPSEDTFGAPAPDPRSEPFAAVADQLAAYFTGELTDFDLPLNLRGTPFQSRVWEALQHIPYGETVTYGELAVEIGSPTASRAVGLANGRNPVSVIVPCHRVVGSGGGLTGYGGGLERKRYLLDFERETRGSVEPALF
ncbi:methylated-DNA--[protein]-cysteine S-methyltransferase [Actinomadura roseirufa]|uniref:methylated-DNA--[protein]-cysteine S-methyltransferase n=1 Tax=Actinomadura roseirufa TaxID=2094049 RepID=UPI0010416C17|nr:methylated-DNA--[protein]-cysteine S-methyltransferase [Actinomadura roseirufa]